jgi:hypothetical protein
MDKTHNLESIKIRLFLHFFKERKCHKGNEWRFHNLVMNNLVN